MQKTYRTGTLTYTKGTLAILFLWLLWGDFCFTLMETITPSLVQVKFVELHTPKTVVGLFASSIPALITFICNPIISFKSDRFRSKWGRRVPFILLTMPLLVACLLALGFVNPIGAWVKDLGLGDRVWALLHGIAPDYFAEFTPATSVLVSLCFLLTLFTFFNTFVNSVFWYLFNDVVPEALLARFISWFRVVSVGAGALYNFFIFQNAGTHYTEIFIGAGALYFIGFGIMCLKVKEGEYPPPPPYIAGQSGALAAVKTYGKECMALRHYWFLFGACMGLIMAGSIWQFGLFYQRELLSLSYQQIGRVAAIASVTQVFIIPLSGWLADRYHPIRVVIVGSAISCCTAPLSMLWYFWLPKPEVVVMVQIALTVCLNAPVGCLVGMMDPPLFMRIFPRERYGQFCSANASLRAVTGIVCGTLSGLYMDLMAGWLGQKTAYCTMGFWSMAGHIIVLTCLLGLYRSWKKHGGDKHYTPPLPA